jgi:hypothetical protein
LTIEISCDILAKGNITNLRQQAVSAISPAEVSVFVFSIFLLINKTLPWNVLGRVYFIA